VLCDSISYGILQADSAEHLTTRGKLFGGNTLKWIDEFDYITASQEFPGNNFLTIALDNVVFRKAVALGEYHALYNYLKLPRQNLCAVLMSARSARGKTTTWTKSSSKPGLPLWRWMRTV
jgi:acyl-CoA hydrolase